MSTNQFPSYASIHQPTQQALQQQLAQEKLLSQVITQIHQSLDLSVILSTVVSEVRKIMQVDRLLIYQFTEPLITTPALSHSVLSTSIKHERVGCVIYEALAHPHISSVLNVSEGDSCFWHSPNYQEKYRHGFVQKITDTATAYQDFPCMLELMKRYDIKSKLIVPVIVQKDFWGILIAHQTVVRNWEDNEQIFLEKIAEHLAIAINQSQLYNQLQYQKDTLEKQVIERTQALYDTLRVAESAHRSKTEFLATISHELRTPLTCIIGISSTLLRWSLTQEDNKIPLEKQRTYLQTIQDSGEHLLELIEEVLELSRLEAGKTALKIHPFSLSKLVHQMLNSFKEKATDKNVEIILENLVSINRDIFVADERRLKQILFNLLSNAIKFTPPEGQIILRVWMEANQAIFQVEDTGIGISDEHRSLLFQKFQQLDPAYHRQHQGMGIGLALTKQLVELHGGLIEVESEVGIGSTFTVMIPSQNQRIKEVTHNEKNLSEMENLFRQDLTNRICVALIDESEDNASFIGDILTASGYQFVWLMEATTSIGQIRLIEPNIVLINTYLLGMDSIEIIEKLRQHSLTKNMKIIAIANKSELAKCFVAGANECLSGPIQPEQLLNKIKSLVLRDKPSIISDVKR